MVCYGSSTIRRRQVLSLFASTLAWPLRAAARDKLPVIGFLWHASNAEEEAPYREPLRQGFADIGYVDGQNVRFVERFAQEKPELFERYAAELVALQVDLLIPVGIPSVLAAQRATRTIPILFVAFPDPVGFRLVASLARPDGNITGLSSQHYDLPAKWVQLLHEIVPNLSRAAVLLNPANPHDAPRLLAEIGPAVEQLGVAIEVFEVRKPEELQPAFDAVVAGRFRAVIVRQHPVFNNEMNRVAALALERNLPMLGPYDKYTDAGALMSYGAAIGPIFRKAPVLADKILKGANPAELPVQQPTQFELAVNLDTAKRLGIIVPSSLLARADRTIDVRESSLTKD